MKFNIFGLGAFRLMLALFVAVSHLYSEMIHGPAAYAVWGFYLLSGYLMTLILNEKRWLQQRNSGETLFIENFSSRKIKNKLKKVLQ